jgi:formylglycine-generating enzyme required for sulfatase activity
MNMKKTIFRVLITFCVAIAMIFGSCGGSGGDDGHDNNNNGPSGNPGGINAEIEMINVPGGSFQMGNPDTSIELSSDDERPVHTVTLTGFSIGKYEVTQEQYEAVMGSLPSRLPGSSNGVGNNYPVYYVSWYDALVFCNKLSVLEDLTPAYSISGSTDSTVWGTVPTSSDATWNAVEIVSGSTGYRLPTEAQWEYAAKGGPSASDPYKIYSGSDTVDDVAWYSGNNGSSGTPTYGSKQVGTKTANELGIYDMSGNVREWCWDWKGSYSSEAQTDPVGASSGSYRVARGAGWLNSAQRVRSADRADDPPHDRDSSLGFRVVRP